MKKQYKLWALLGKFFKAIIKILYKYMAANLLVMGSIFGNRPIVKPDPGKKEIGRNKD